MQTDNVRYLIVVRHTKAAPAAPGASDFDRPLSGRGKRQCDVLRTWASDGASLGAFGPTTALVSTARRTRETFRRAFDDTGFVTSVSYSDLIYNGQRDVSAEDLLIDLAAIDPVTTSLLVVAHNPTVHELVVRLADEVPQVLRQRGYPLGGAFVLALGEGQPIGLSHYPLVATFIPEV
ncbi:MAG: histidine phosphatase family protein [Acidobacteria bacterium]|nr:histidine phosphatase family protein [Acidobacteriota bacterium]